MNKDNETTENLEEITKQMHKEAKEILKNKSRKFSFDFGTITIYRHGEVQVIKL